MERPAKRLRHGAEENDAAPDRSVRSGHSTPRSLDRLISPPRKENRSSPEAPPTEKQPPLSGKEPVASPSVINSPFKLTRIRDLPEESNLDTVTLKDLLGDPLISECWEFNYLHDINFLMGAFDRDTRDLVKVHVVHGFWKQEDPRRLSLQNAASRYKNVSLHAAFLSEMFGTHHSKMMVLLRHDDTAQVIITTANMIPKDWANMTQGVWRSPALPLVSGPAGASLPGSGSKFKVDLLNYLRAYDSRRVTCKPLVEELEKYDFSAVRGTLIASVPGRHSIHDDSPTRWGWAAMRQALRGVPVREGKSEIVTQVSSIATMGPTDKWLRETLFDALSSCKGSSAAKPDLIKSPSSTKGPSMTKPEFKVMFPTPDEIRRSLDGYRSGASIHTKIQSAQQVKQLRYLKPIFCHWGNDSPAGQKLPEDTVILDGGRNRAAPHIKTYVRYAENGTIDWALLTSANLSKQAWGEPETTSGELRISSYEIGVLVWPALFGQETTMVPTFQRDAPGPEQMDGDGPVVGLRIPYSIPVQQYGESEVPWVATATYNEPDWMGEVWS